MVKISELFNTAYGNKFDLNKMIRNDSCNISFVSRTEKNNGVAALVQRYKNVEPYTAGLISVALGGSVLSSFVQSNNFYTAQNVAVLSPKQEMTLNEKLYYCWCIQKNRFRYSACGREANKTLKDILVPAKEEIPSWVNSINTNVLVSQVESLKKISSCCPFHITQDSIGNDRVNVSDIFDISYGTSLELSRLKRSSSGVNFISRTSQNNGVSAKIAILENTKPIDGGVLTVAAGGSVLETFYQTEPFYTGFHILCLKPKKQLLPEEMLFYAACIRKNKYLYSYGRQANKTLKDVIVPAPSAIPSWVYGVLSNTVDQLKALDI